MWIIQPRQHIETKAWRLTAESDAGGGFYVGCQHDHTTTEEAQQCQDARVFLNRLTGMPEPIDSDAHGY